MHSPSTCALRKLWPAKCVINNTYIFYCTLYLGMGGNWGGGGGRGGREAQGAGSDFKHTPDLRVRP